MLTSLKVRVTDPKHLLNTVAIYKNFLFFHYKRTGGSLQLHRNYSLSSQADYHAALSEAAEAAGDEDEALQQYYNRTVQ